MLNPNNLLGAGGVNESVLSNNKSTIFLSMA